MILRNLPKKYKHIPYISCCFLCLSRTPARGAGGEETNVSEASVQESKERRKASLKDPTSGGLQNLHP